MRTVSLISLLLVAGSASAHSLNVECRIVGGRLAVSAFYDGPAPAASAVVALTGADGAAIAGGSTDGDGNWIGPALSVGEYRVVVTTGDGHRRSVSISITAETATMDEQPGSTLTYGFKLILGVLLIAVGAAAVKIAMTRKIGSNPPS